MERRTLTCVLCGVCALLAGVWSVSAAGGEPETPLTPQGEKLLATYTEMLATLQKEIAASAHIAC